MPQCDYLDQVRTKYFPREIFYIKIFLEKQFDREAKFQKRSRNHKWITEKEKQMQTKGKSKSEKQRGAWSPQNYTLNLQLYEDIALG